MFLRLRKKIILYIIFSSLLFTTVISLISFLLLSQVLFNNYKNAAVETVNHSINKSIFAINAAKNPTLLISEHEMIHEALSEEYFAPYVIPILNTLKNTSFGILGVTLYTEHHIYTTSSITSPPSFAEMMTNLEFSTFVESEATHYLSIRTSHIARVYNNIRYNPEYGMISHVVKIKNDQSKIGFLFVDINPQYIYRNFLSYSNYMDYSNTETFIITQKGSYLKSSYNSPDKISYLDDAEFNAITHSNDRKYLIIHTPFIQEHTSIVTAIPLKPYYNRLLNIGLILIITLLILFICTLLIGKKLTNSIINPLIKLHRKMEETEELLP